MVPTVTLLNFIILAIFIVFVLSGLLMWLWNITIPELFGLRPITYWQAFRLFIIASILFGGGTLIDLG